MRKIIALAIIVILYGSAQLALLAYSQSSTYIVDVNKAGWYYIPLHASRVLIVDPYGYQLEAINYRTIVTSDWWDPGLYVYIEKPGRYYIFSGQGESGNAQLAASPQPRPIYIHSGDYVQLANSKIIKENFDVDYQYKNSTTYSLLYYVNGFKITSGTSTGYLATELTITALTTTTITVHFYGFAHASGHGFNNWTIMVDGTPVATNTSAEWITTLEIQAGTHTLRLGAYVYYSTNTGGIIFYVNITATGIIGSRINPLQINAIEAPLISINSDTNNVKVYSNKFIITANESLLHKYLLIPVDDSEVSSLLDSYNIVVYENETGYVRPAQLITVNGQKYIIFESWTDNTSGTFLVIWNYPQAVSPTLDGVFTDTFTSDPLLRWQELYKYNVSRVEYSSGTLTINGSNFLYIIGLNVSGVYEAVFGFMNADNGYVVAGNQNISVVPVAFSGTGLFFLSGKLYDIEFTSNQYILQLNMSQISFNVSINESRGNSIVLAVSSTNTGYIYGAIALANSTSYNVTFYKQLLRVPLTIERYNIGYSISGEVGYWSYSVPLTVKVDPVGIPSDVNSIIVRIWIPEDEWVSMGYMLPGAVDLAVVDSQYRLLDYYISPYKTVNGTRAVYIRLPWDGSQTVYHLYVLIGNNKLNSSLAKPTTFPVYYDADLGLGTMWEENIANYTITHVRNVNFIYVEGSQYVVLGLTPYDFYIITPQQLSVQHGSAVSTLQYFGGTTPTGVDYLVRWNNALGSADVYIGDILYQQIENLDSDVYAWPPVIVGAKNARFIGAGYMPNYAYALGTVQGGIIKDKTINVEQQPPPDPMESIKYMAPILLILLIIGIVMRMMEHPPQVQVVKREGVI
ncbi:MAG: hypothetical protein GSR81_02850 [Desulfurococcales archaeon]|nr:hypothetical protein [Desulfurococcales archaeon]